MRLVKAASAAGIALLCTAVLAGVSLRAEAAAATVPIPADCLALASGDLGTTRTGTFTDDVQSACLELPSVAKSAIAVLQPASSSRSVLLTRTVAAGDGTVVCREQVLAAGACVLDGVGPFRLLVAPRWANDTGAYALVVQPLSGDTGCPAGLPLGRVGTAEGVDVTLSAGTFARCFTLASGQHSTRELVTMARTEGIGGARFAVFNESGEKTCGSASAAEVSLGYAALCNFVPTMSYTVLIWNQGRDATFRLARRDLKPDALSCPDVRSTVVGGPAMADSISMATDVRCYTVTSGRGDRYFMALRSPSTAVSLIAIADNGVAFCASLSCLTDSGSSTRRYRVVVSVNTAGVAVPFQLDTWAVLTDGVLSPGCEAVTSIAYGLGPLTGTLTDERPGRCLRATMSTTDAYRLVNGNSDGTGLPRPYIIAPADSVDFPLNLNPCSYCQPDTGSYNTRVVQALIILSPGGQFGAFAYEARITCLHQPCGGEPYAMTAMSPTTAVTDSKVTFAFTGSAFDETDTVQLSRFGSSPIIGRVRSVTADRHTMTAEADLSGAAAGTWTVSTISALAVTSAVQTLQVTWPAITATGAPSVSGAIQVGSTVRATTGGWNPAPAIYSYQWSSDGKAIPGAIDAAYKVPSTLVGHQLTVTVTASLPGHTNGVVTSAATVVGPGPAPTAVRAPAITGTVRVRRTVKVSAGNWSPTPDTYTYRWFLNGKAIMGATRTSLKITKAMVGKKLTVTVTARKSGYRDGRRTTASVTLRPGK